MNKNIYNMNKNIYQKIISVSIVVLMLSTFLTPFLVLAQEDDGWSGLVPCGTIKYKEGEKVVNGVDMKGLIANPCNFEYFMKLINNTVNFILFKLVLPISAIMFAYAGGLLLFAGGEVSQLAKAKKIFTNVVIGIVLSAGSWLIINSVLSILGYDGSWIGF